MADVFTSHFVARQSENTVIAVLSRLEESSQIRFGFGARLWRNGGFEVEDCYLFPDLGGFSRTSFSAGHAVKLEVGSGTSSTEGVRWRSMGRKGEVQPGTAAAKQSTLLWPRFYNREPGLNLMNAGVH
jgi:hypothetical protein